MVFKHKPWDFGPIEHMIEPTLLLTFTLMLSLAGLYVLVWRLKSLDINASARAEKIPEKLDPYKVAYLRGEDSELLRVAMVDLVNRGVLKNPQRNYDGLEVVTDVDQWICDEQQASGWEFTAIQRSLIEHFQTANTATSILYSESKANTKRFMEEYQDWAREKKFLRDEKSAETAKWMAIVWGVALALFFLTCLWIRCSPTVHREVLESYAIGGVSCLLLSTVAFCAYVEAIPRLSRRGKKFLTDVQLIYRSLRSLKSFESDKTRRANLRVSDSKWPLLAAGIFGVAALQGSSLDVMYQSFRVSATSEPGGETQAGGCGSGGGSGGCGGGGGCGCGGGGGCGCGG